QSWNLTLQRTLKWGFVGEAGYVATRQVRQLGFLELNWAPFGGGRNGRQLFSPRDPATGLRFGRTASTRLAAPIGGSHYDSLQTRLQRRFANGYQVEVGYTWSKSIGVVNATGSDNLPPIQIPAFYGLNRSITDIDRTHNLEVTNIAELPLGKGRRWLNHSGILSAIVGGWQVNNLFSWQSGRPFSATAS